MPGTTCLGPLLTKFTNHRTGHTPRLPPLLCGTPFSPKFRWSPPGTVPHILAGYRELRQAYRYVSVMYRYVTCSCSVQLTNVDRAGIGTRAYFELYPYTCRFKTARTRSQRCVWPHLWRTPKTCQNYRESYPRSVPQLVCLLPLAG